MPLHDADDNVSQQFLLTLKYICINIELPWLILEHLVELVLRLCMNNCTFATFLLSKDLWQLIFNLQIKKKHIYK